MAVKSAPSRLLSLPSHRSPYGFETPIKGEENALVRPYLAAVEERCGCEVQAHRRVSLTLAADFGVDLDEHVVGAAV
ncbi:hypothetical protein ACFYWS_35565 [Streptomyces sp. NPDC002795]|uniref:hypothetical protein n=1 Tax=Streptomyces sp. NPDC002795 TaxID=3364665 RepID=UPI00369D4460